LQSPGPINFVLATLDELYKDKVDENQKQSDSTIASKPIATGQLLSTWGIVNGLDVVQLCPLNACHKKV
jgi:hypothetical protein